VLDAYKKREILAILSVGCSRRAAAQYVGCSVTTIQNTAERDEAFAASLQRAESQFEFTHMKNISNAAKEARYWRAAAWVLERLNPDHYAQRSPHVVTFEQVRTVLVEFAGFIANTLSTSRHRQEILKQMDELIGKLGASRPGKQTRDDG